GGAGAGPSPPNSSPLDETFLTKIHARAAGRATTIAVVATDAALDQAQATRMAWAAHDGIARAIAPAHTPYDGDLIFAAATGARPASDDPLEPIALGHAAAICLARSIARAVYEAVPAPGDPFPCWRSA
ncbi:MAG: P1 family peptidase, partial [Pseudomonadota bacterium]